MDAAWLALLAVLFLVAGLAALAYDTVRRRDANRPYPFPDAETNLLTDEEIEAMLAGITPAKPAPALPPTPVADPAVRPPGRIRGIRLRHPRLPHLLGRLPRLALHRPSFTRRRAALLAALALPALVAGLGVAAVLGREGAPAAAPGTTVVAVCGFAGAPPRSEPSAPLLADLSQVSAASGSQLEVRQCPRRPRTQQEADEERARLHADILVWGQVHDTGGLDVVLNLAPGFALRAAAWQTWSSANPGELLLPHSLSTHLPGPAGTEPLGPLVLALAGLRRGEFSEAGRAASGAYNTLGGMEGSTEAAALVYSVSLSAGGDAQGAASLLAGMERAGQVGAEALVDRAWARIQVGDLSGAGADLDRALAERDAPEPALAAAHLLRARVLLASNDAQSAATEADLALQSEPGSLTARLVKAEALYRLAQPDPARKELDAIIAAAPGAAPAHRLTGLVWLMLGKPAQALHSLDQAESLYTTWVGALHADEARAQVTGDAESGKAATQGIISLNRELATVHLYRGMALADVAKSEPAESFFGGLWRRLRSQPTTYERAAAELQEAQRLDGNRLDLLLQMGKVYGASGDYSRAAQVLKQAVAAAPDAPEPYLALAQIYEDQGNRGEAVRILDELLARAPHSYQAYERLYALYSKSDPQAATASLQRAIHLPASSPTEHLWRGKFLYMLDRYDEASFDLGAATADPSLIEAHLLLGKILEAQRNGPQALAHFRAVLDRQPNDPTALLEAGRLLLLAGQEDEADKLFSRLTTLVPGSVDGHIAYSQLLSGRGEYDRAIAEARRAVEQGDSRADAHFALGLAYEAKRDWPSASEQFTEATRRDPKHFESFIHLAGSLFSDDRYTESAEAAGAAILLRPDDPETYRLKAEAQLAARDTEGALASLGQALHLSPSLARALALTARVYALKGDLPSARHYAQEAVSAAGSDPVGLLALGEVELAAGAPAEATRAFDAARAVAPGSAEAITGQGRAQALAGDRDRAISLYRAAIESDTNYAPAHLYLGHTMSERGQWGDAFNEYSQAVRLRPHWPEALYYEGRAFMQRKDLKSAAGAFEAAAAASPNLMEAWYGLGIAERGRGRPAQAIAALERATELSPGYAEAWLYLGLSYEEAGRRADARVAFARARDLATNPSTRDQAAQGLSRVN